MIRHKKAHLIFRHFSIQLGAAFAALALNSFMLPNRLIDGGVVGISIIISYLSDVPLGLIIIMLNAPFVILGFRKMGRSFAVTTIISVLSLAVWVSILHLVPPVTNDLFLASIFGGMIMGTGVGLILRNGGSLDGTEILALIYNIRVSFSIGQIVMFLNFFILAVAGLVFGWDRAMYSMVTYFIAFKVIDLVIEGIDEVKAVYIISSNAFEIKKALIDQFRRGITVFRGEGGYSSEEKDILYIILRRSEIYELKEIVFDLDDSAFVSISNIHEVVGKNIKFWK